MSWITSSPCVAHCQNNHSMLTSQSSQDVWLPWMFAYYLGADPFHRKRTSWLWLFSVYNFSSQLHLIAVLGNYSCFRGNCCWVRKYSSGFPSIQSKLHDATGVLLYLWRNSTFKTYPSIQENCHPWTGDADCSCKIGLIANSIGFRTFLIRKKYHQRSLFTSLVPVFGWVAASWRSLWNSVS